MNDKAKAEAITAANEAVAPVMDELVRAWKTHGPFNSVHEAFAVALEESDELCDAATEFAVMVQNTAMTSRYCQVENLWGAIKSNDLARAEHEAVQLAAMAAKLAAHIRMVRARVPKGTKLGSRT